MEIPVYLFTGFLEAGKTKFIQETLEDKGFNEGERTLLLLCEEGIEEYNPLAFASKNVFQEVIEEQENFTTETLVALQKKNKASRVIIEYNGMWPITVLTNALPKDWQVYQQMYFADSNTFLTYNANMRSLVFDKISGAEVVIFNRCSDDVDKMELHKTVRAISRRIQIVYEYTDGSIENDDIEDPLPFDVTADTIVVADNDYALWYRDMMEDMTKYDGKVMKFKGIVARDKRFDQKTFVIGRHIMTCCTDDIQYGALIAVCSETCTLEIGDWVNVTAKLSIEYHKGYRKKGPLLNVIEYALTSAPQEKVVTF